MGIPPDDGRIVGHNRACVPCDGAQGLWPTPVLGVDCGQWRDEARILAWPEGRKLIGQPGWHCAVNDMRMLDPLRAIGDTKEQVAR